MTNVLVKNNKLITLFSDTTDETVIEQTIKYMVTQFSSLQTWKFIDKQTPQIITGNEDFIKQIIIFTLLSAMTLYKNNNAMTDILSNCTNNIDNTYEVIVICADYSNSLYDVFAGCNMPIQYAKIMRLDNTINTLQSEIAKEYHEILSMNFNHVYDENMICDLDNFKTSFWNQFKNVIKSSSVSKLYTKIVEVITPIIYTYNSINNIQN